MYQEDIEDTPFNDIIWSSFRKKKKKKCFLLLSAFIYFLIYLFILLSEESFFFVVHCNHNHEKRGVLRFTYFFPCTWQT